MPSVYERNTNTQTVTFCAFVCICSLSVCGVGGYACALRSVCVYLQLRPLDRLSGRCFACESGQGRIGIIRFGAQLGGAGINEDWGCR